MRQLQWRLAASCVLIFCTSLLFAQDGANLYKVSCASCHDSGAERVPSRETLMMMSPERVLTAMESGAMMSMASLLSSAQRRAIAEFVTGKTVGEKTEGNPSPTAMCANAPGAFSDSAGPQWNGWGANVTNTRSQDAKIAGLSATAVPRLKLKWAFGYPGDVSASTQPTIAGGRVFVGSQGGNVYSLDASSGCLYWWFQAPATVRSAVGIGKVEQDSGPSSVAFFGDTNTTVYAVAAGTGKLLWKVRVDSHLVARITGSPTFYRGRLYVPVSSIEEGSAAAPDYQCCTFRGSVVALNAATGKQIWKTYTISEEAKPTKKNKNGTQLWGPSGAAIWSSPTIDEKRNAIYVATGDNYSDPPTETSDAILAMDLDSGKILWSRQMTISDAFTVACGMPVKTNCPDSNGPDLDFGSPPILVTLLNGRRALVAGQKSGVVHAIDPDKQGEIIWQDRIGHGGALGGVEWGSAADQSNIYVARSDIRLVPGRIPGMFGLEADPSAGAARLPLVWKMANGSGTRRLQDAAIEKLAALPNRRL